MDGYLDLVRGFPRSPIGLLLCGCVALVGAVVTGNEWATGVAVVGHVVSPRRMGVMPSRSRMVRASSRVLCSQTVKAAARALATVTGGPGWGPRAGSARVVLTAPPQASRGGSCLAPARSARPTLREGCGS